MTSKTYIYGKHAVLEAILHASHTVEQVLIASNFDDKMIPKTIKDSKIPTGILGKLPREIDPEATHQGIIAEIDLSKLVKPFNEFIKNLSVGADTSLVILGELQDPQNVGAVIRSAAAFGISGILIPAHNQAPISGTVIKVSAGMAFRIPLVAVGNVNTTIHDLKEKGFWIYGLSGKAKQSIVDEKFDAPTVFILGNESKGIRQKTEELCDILLSIPIDPKCESLNAAASAAVAMYAWSVKRSIRTKSLK